MIVLILASSASCATFVSGAKFTNQHSMPNLTIPSIYLTWNQKGRDGEIAILPSLNERFYVRVLVSNSGSAPAVGFVLDVQISWQGTGTLTPQEFQHRFVSLDSQAVDQAYFGPFKVDSPSNMTVQATLNPSSTVSGTGYQTHVSWSAVFHIGELFPNAKVPSTKALWQMNEATLFNSTYIGHAVEL